MHWPVKVKLGTIFEFLADCDLVRNLQWNKTAQSLSKVYIAAAHRLSGVKG